MGRCRLRSYDQTPPSGYCYQEAGFGNICLPMIEALAQTLSAFRKGNGRPRSKLLECLQDIDEYNCLRLGCLAAYCIPVDQPQSAAPQVAIGEASPIVAPCKGCGGVPA